MKYFWIILSLFTLIACGDKLTPEQPKDDFNKAALLSNIGEQIIVPRYQNLVNSISELEISLQNFDAERNNDNLHVLKENFIQSYLAFEWVSSFEIGPAEKIGFNQAVNSYPCDTAQVINNLGKSDVNLGAANNANAKGFPAFEFALYVLSEGIVDNPSGDYTNNVISHLHLLLNDIKTLTSSVSNEWESDYIGTFKTADGNDVGSSLGKLVNGFSKSLEEIKNVKLGIPLGKQSLNEPRVDLVEGKYAGISAQLAKMHTKGLFNLYKGVSTDNIDGLGFDDYLLHLNASANGLHLDTQIKEAFNKAISELEDIPDPMAETILTDDSSVQKAYSTFQSTLIRLIKVDMSSAFGVQISYVDNDGD